MSQSSAKLIYVGDPMCSWCYGIAPEITKVRDNYKDRFEYELIMGGLRPYNTQTMVEIKDFLKHHWEEVNEKSGQEFSYDILDRDDISYDTEPPSRASVVVRKLAPEKEMSFFKKVQASFYKDNKNLHLSESYRSSLDELGIDFSKFDALFESEDMKNEVKLDFQKAQQIGVRSFPTMILEYKEQLYLVANGYSTSEKMIARIDNLLEA